MRRLNDCNKSPGESTLLIEVNSPQRNRQTKTYHHQSGFNSIMTLSLESWSGSSNSSSAQKSARLMICELPSKAVSLVFRSPCEESPVGIPCLKGKPRGFLYHVVTMVVGSSRKRMYLKKEATQASRTELLKQKRNQLNHFESL